MYKTQAKKVLASFLALVMTVPMLVGPTTVNVYASQPPPPQTQTAAATNNPFVTGGRVRDQEATPIPNLTDETLAINGEYVGTTIVIGNTVLTPALTFPWEEVGLTVEWNEENEILIIWDDYTTVQTNKDERSFQAGHRISYISEPLQTIDDVLYVPLTGLLGVFRDLAYEWDGENLEITHFDDDWIPPTAIIPIGLEDTEIEFDRDGYAIVDFEQDGEIYQLELPQYLELDGFPVPLEEGLVENIIPFVFTTEPADPVRRTPEIHTTGAIVAFSEGTPEWSWVNHPDGRPISNTTRNITTPPIPFGT